MAERGRPRQFDRQSVLNQAMRLFWANGFRSTSVEDLLGEMGINRGSMYATFGDKRSLFAESISHYAEEFVDKLGAIVGREGAVRDNIRASMRFVANLGDGKECTGCLLTHAAVEVAERDDELAQLVRNGMSAASKKIELAIQRGIDSGELGNVQNVQATAAILIAIFQGLNVFRCAGYPAEYIENVIESAMVHVS